MIPTFLKKFISSENIESAINQGLPAAAQGLHSMYGNSMLIFSVKKNGDLIEYKIHIVDAAGEARAVTTEQMTSIVNDFVL